MRKGGIVDKTHSNGITWRNYWSLCSDRFITHKANPQIFLFLLSCITDKDISSNRVFFIIIRRNGCDGVISNMNQRALPQLNRSEDTRKTPHILIFEIAAIAPSINFDSQTITSLFHKLRDVELSRGHRILAISYLLPIYPNIHSRLHTAKMKDKITIIDILLGDIKKSNIRTYRVAMVKRIPIAIWFAGHSRIVRLERIGHIRIDRYTISLHLPVSWHRNHVPATYIVIVAIEIGRT